MNHFYCGFSRNWGLSKVDKMKKYICFSGEVVSEDGDIHRVSCRKLPFLYGVNPRFCLFVDSENDLRGYSEEYLESLIWLSPRSDGSYYDTKEVVI